MNLYMKILCLRNQKDLCEQTIVTQNGFHNTIHTDYSSCLNIQDTADVLKKLKENENGSSNPLLYINRVLQQTNGNLPKSTTCCWSLRTENVKYRLVQYFILHDYRVAYDVSSNVTSSSFNIGATFMSSMFNHCTSVPIWIDQDDNIHLVGPKHMYNFAWGSDGGSCNR